MTSKLSAFLRESYGTATCISCAIKRMLGACRCISRSTFPLFPHHHCTVTNSLDFWVNMYVIKNTCSHHNDTSTGHRWIKLHLLPVFRKFSIFHISNSSSDRGVQRPPAVSCALCVLLYWPERAGGHLQRGWGQTCTHRGDPRWCKSSPGETASPPLCRYRAREQVQSESKTAPRCARTHCNRTAWAARTGNFCPWWQSGGWSLSSRVYVRSLQGLLELKQMLTGWQGQSLLDVREVGAVFVNGRFPDWLYFKLETTEANRINGHFIYSRSIWMQKFPQLLNSECIGVC